MAANAPNTFQVPVGSALVWVEVFTGPYLRSLTRPDQAFPAGELRARNLRAVLSTSVLTGVSNAAVMAGGTITMAANGGASVGATGSDRPRLRSKGGVRVVKQDGGGPEKLTMTGEVGRSRNLGLSATTVGSVTQINEEVGDNQDFLSLKWSQLTQADSSPGSTTAVQIPGGVYVFWEDGSLHYYDQTLSDYKATAATNPNDPGQVLSSDLKEVRSATNLANLPGGIDVSSRTLNINKDLAVVPSASGTSAICITPREGHPLYSGDPVYNLAAGQPNLAFSRHPTVALTSATLSCPSDTVILCDVTGNQGTIISGGSAVVAATSMIFDQAAPSPGPPPPSPPPPIFEPSPTQNQGLSLYVKKDLTLSSFQPANVDYVGPIATSPFSAYGDLHMEGLVYVWGNFTGYTANPGGSSPNDGRLTVRGSLVAYGADPETGLPGSEGRGKVDLFSKAVDLVFDSALLATTPLTSSNPTNLRPYFYDFDQ